MEDYVNKGWIEIEGWGSGYGHWQRIKIYNKSDFTVSFYIQPGTWMKSITLLDQDMLILDKYLVTIGPRGFLEQNVATACMNWGLKLPSTLSRYNFAFPPSTDMKSKIAVLRRGMLDNSNYAITQSMVWMLMHNATNSQILNHSIYPLGRYPTQYEVNQARTLYNGLQ
jgi:hypothetical protein